MRGPERWLAAWVLASPSHLFQGYVLGYVLVQRQRLAPAPVDR
jgi:hypothetical protein